MKHKPQSCREIEADLIATATGDTEPVARGRVEDHRLVGTILQGGPRLPRQANRRHPVGRVVAEAGADAPRRDPATAAMILSPAPCDRFA